MPGGFDSECISDPIIPGFVFFVLISESANLLAKCLVTVARDLSSVHLDWSDVGFVPGAIPLALV